jgi:UDP-N-acetyl-D-glucosamine dehydrogenase
MELAGEINTNMPYHVLSSVGSALNHHKKSVNGARVLILGVAYKKDIDDLRESPSLTIIERPLPIKGEVRIFCRRMVPRSAITTYNEMRKTGKSWAV